MSLQANEVKKGGFKGQWDSNTLGVNLMELTGHCHFSVSFPVD